MKNIFYTFCLLLISSIGWGQQGNTVTYVANSAQEVLEVGGTGYFTAKFTPSSAVTGATKIIIKSWTVTIATNAGTIPGNIDGFNVSTKTYNENITYDKAVYESTGFYVQKTFSAAFGSDSPQNTKVTVSCKVEYINSTNAVIGGSGNSGDYPGNRTVVLRKVKAPTITNTAFGCSTTNVQVCATDFGDADFFTWTITGGTITSGFGQACINVTPSSNSMVATCVVKRSTGNPNYTATATRTIGMDPFVSTATISGNPVICVNANSIYTIANLGAGNTVAWSSSNTAIATVSNATQSQVQVNGVANGTVNLIANITNSCGQIAPLVKIPINIGVPSPPNGIDSKPIWVRKNMAINFSVTPVLGATSYKWTIVRDPASIGPCALTSQAKFTINGTQTINSTTATNVIINVGSCYNDYLITCSATNPCGNAVVYERYLTTGASGTSPCYNNTAVSRYSLVQNPIREGVLKIRTPHTPIKEEDDFDIGDGGGGAGIVDGDSPCEGPYPYNGYKTRSNPKAISVSIYDFNGEKVYENKFDLLTEGEKELIFKEEILIEDLDLKANKYILVIDDGNEPEKHIIIVE